MRHMQLCLPHTGNQKDHFTDAMIECNKQIVLQGQPKIGHYCDKCMHTYKTEDGSYYKVEAAVMDGLTIGHPCCTLFACPLALSSNHHQFCKTHSHLCLQCAISSCSHPVVQHSKTVDGRLVRTTMKTCDDPMHQEMEWLNKEQSKANFQLSQKLMRHNVSHLNDAMAKKHLIDLVDLEDTKEWFEVEDGRVCMFTINNPGATGELDASVSVVACPLKPNSGNKKIKAQFGCQRTHNEQVIVWPCGMLCSHVTFFGAEAVSNVLVSCSSLFFYLVMLMRTIAHGQEDLLCARCKEARTSHL